MVDKMKGEKSQLTKDIATLSVRLAESKHNYSMLQKENERYKNDMNLAIQLLQCKPDNFVSQKLDTLPVDTQARVSQYVMSKTSKPSSTTQSKCGNENDTFDASEYEFNISASLMSKILEDSIQDTVTKHCDTCTCSKSQNKPFCYNESYYSVGTQTILTEDANTHLCSNCKSEIKSLNSNLSTQSNSLHITQFVEGNRQPSIAMSQPVIEPFKSSPENLPVSSIDNTAEDKINASEKNALDAYISIDSVNMRKKCNSNTMEPSVHHKLCDRTKTSFSSKRSSTHSNGNDDLHLKEEISNLKEIKIMYDNPQREETKIRKNSHSSMSVLSKTSSLAKSTGSTHKSNTQVGPGPRFCHLRMQAGSKNILVDNAEPDVPPVLYRRQSKCNEISLFKDLTYDTDNFVDLTKNEHNEINKNVNNSIVVETTLIDVHVDNNNKELNNSAKNTLINPILLNVSSSPLQPLKTHNFSHSSEHNNNTSLSLESQQNISETDNLLNDFADNTVNNNPNSDTIKVKNISPTDNHDMKIFNFDRYEQSKSQYNRPLRKIDMSQLHALENTKIAKDFPPLGSYLKPEKKADVSAKSSLPAVVNVYPNLTQTHLKVNEGKKIISEQSTSSLSSDDSAALLQKQQLLRVAEWVEKNLEQQNSFNDPLEEEVNFNSRPLRRDIKLRRLTETLNEIALNMPHPVSKYSKQYPKDTNKAWVHNNSSVHPMLDKKSNSAAINQNFAHNIVKETIFPVESGEATITEVSKDVGRKRFSQEAFDIAKGIQEGLKVNGDKEITPEDLARMEYNVKKFLLSGPQWAKPGSASRNRCTSSKTETDV
ncbi:hypothetical protein ACJJTC_006215 [Scirpophaga incertulas]